MKLCTRIFTLFIFFNASAFESAGFITSFGHEDAVSMIREDGVFMVV
jgi:hypothetical protein